MAAGSATARPGGQRQVSVAARLGWRLPLRGAVMQAQLTSSVQHSLSMYMFDNAKFLCERLAAEFPCEVWAAAWGLAAPPYRAHVPVIIN